MFNPPAWRSIATDPRFTRAFTWLSSGLPKNVEIGVSAGRPRKWTEYPRSAVRWSRKCSYPRVTLVCSPALSVSCGRHTITLQIDVLPEAAGVFVHTVQAKGQRVAKRLIEVGSDAAYGPNEPPCTVSSRNGEKPASLVTRLITPPAPPRPKIMAIGTFERFYALQIVEIAIILDVVPHAVDEKIGRGAIAPG